MRLTANANLLFLFPKSQSFVAEPVGTLRRELSQTVLTTYNLFHEKQMTIVSNHCISQRNEKNK